MKDQGEFARFVVKQCIGTIQREVSKSVMEDKASPEAALTHALDYLDRNWREVVHLAEMEMDDDDDNETT